MKISEIKEKAKSVGVKAGKMKKDELVRAIQQAENNNPCFGSNDGQCGQWNCCFMQDCVKASKALMPCGA